MNKRRIDPAILPYDVEEFAVRHGLSPKSANAILCANSKSKEQADIGAELFKQARARFVAREKADLPL